MVIVHDARKQQDPAGVSGDGVSVPKRWWRRHARFVRFATVIFACVFAFVLGVGAHQQGWIDALRTELVKLRQPTRTLDAILNAAELPTLTVDMKYKHFDKIEKKRQEALRRGQLFASDEDFVPAEIRLEGRTVPVKMRLKGDLVDHLDSDKWSFRIHVRDDEQIFGMRRFSLQHPKTRNYLSEWGWLENLRGEQVLALRYRFVNVVFNGTQKGIYALEEHFSKELLESQDRRESVMIHFDESLFWEQRGALAGAAPVHDVFSLGSESYRHTPIDLRQASRVAQDPVLARQAETAIGLLRSFQEGTARASHVFDAAILGRFLAIVELWEARHGIVNNSIQLYFNPISGRLEPIGFDGDAQTFLEAGLYAPVRPWTRQALRDPEIARAYVSELYRVSRREYLEDLRAKLEGPARDHQRSLYQEYPFLLSDEVFAALEKKQAYIRISLATAEVNPILALAPVVPTAAGLAIEVRSIIALPVEVLGFRFQDRFIPAASVWTGSPEQLGDSDDHPTVILAEGTPPVGDAIEYARFLLEGIDAPAGFDVTAVKVETRLVGLVESHLTSVRTYAPAVSSALPQPPALADALSRHPFLEQGAAGVLTVRRGRWEVDGDLVLPAGHRLEAGPGTTLLFRENAVFLARSALWFEGKETEPVRLGPIEERWAGLVVLEAQSPSNWKHVTVEGTAGVERDGWILTGGATFYRSPISMTSCFFADSTAEDALNLIRCEFEFRQCRFVGSSSDAFDGDWTEGTIESCEFRKVGGDAIDLSGSTVTVIDVLFDDIEDKALSVGEGSHLNGRSIVARDVGIGVASKDSSHTTLEHVTIRGAAHAAFAVYVKKKEFGPADITANQVEFEDTPRRTLVQTGSWIKLEGTMIEGSDVDVKALYEAEILGN